MAEYLWDGDSYELSREYVNDANGVVATLDYDFTPGAGAEVGWHLRDHLGSTYAVIAAPVTTVPYGAPLKLGQRILWTGHYEAFGRPDSLRPVCPGFFPNPIQYTGYYSDGDIFEHYYAKARYYDPYTGRFLSRDPADFDPESFPGAINRYTYTANNPLRYVDPDGEFFFLPLFLAITEVTQTVFTVATILDAAVTSLINYTIEGDIAEAFKAGFFQVASNILLYTSAISFTNNLINRPTTTANLAAVWERASIVNPAEKAYMFSGFLDYGRQSAQTIFNTGGRWGRNYSSMWPVHHGLLGGYALPWAGRLLGLRGTSWGGISLIVTVDDFVQHLGQIIKNDKNWHTICHYLGSKLFY